jgi:hypothetical protein
MDELEFLYNAYEYARLTVDWILANPLDIWMPSKIEGLLQETKTYVESLFY